MGATSEYEGVLHFEGFDLEETPDETLDAPLRELFLQGFDM